MEKRACSIANLQYSLPASRVHGYIASVSVGIILLHPVLIVLPCAHEGPLRSVAGRPSINRTGSVASHRGWWRHDAPLALIGFSMLVKRH